MKSVRYSKQRQIILENVSRRCDHPSVEMVYDSVKESIPNISLGTVYRNLNFLCEQGDLRRLDIGDGIVHFDRNYSHMHFVCDQCKEIYDMELDQEVSTKLIQIPHTVNYVGIILRGVCESCKSKSN